MSFLQISNFMQTGRRLLILKHNSKLKLEHVISQIKLRKQLNNIDANKHF